MIENPDKKFGKILKLQDENTKLENILLKPVSKIGPLDNLLAELKRKSNLAEMEEIRNEFEEDKVDFETIRINEPAISIVEDEVEEQSQTSKQYESLLTDYPDFPSVKEIELASAQYKIVGIFTSFTSIGNSFFQGFRDYAIKTLEITNNSRVFSRSVDQAIRYYGSKPYNTNISEIIKSLYILHTLENKPTIDNFGPQTWLIFNQKTIPAMTKFIKHLAEKSNNK